MAFEAYFNRAENTHENEQFFRISSKIKAFIDDQGLDGLLIGNPFNQKFTFFRPDAILYYTYGLLLLDFKDYEGVLSPSVDRKRDQFDNGRWSIETPQGNIVEVKGGSHANPFKQLFTYRWIFQNDVFPLTSINRYLTESEVSILNIFSGPISIDKNLPRSIRYYGITDEDQLQRYLFTFSRTSEFHPRVADELKRMFPAPVWTSEINIPSVVEEDISSKLEDWLSDNVELESIDAPTEAIDFLLNKDQKVLLLTNGLAEQRDSWVNSIYECAWEYGIDRVVVLAHSARICDRIRRRANIQSHSIYSVIYGGESKTILIDDQEFNLIPIADAQNIGENPLFIVHESHLINNEYREPEGGFIYGSNKLIADLASYINQIPNAKIIFVGDACSLSFGDVKKSAVIPSLLSELFKQSVDHYSELNYCQNDDALSFIKEQLTQSVLDTHLYNRLRYTFDDNLVNCSKDQFKQLIEHEFSVPLNSEPKLGLLYSMNSECMQINRWIKKYCLKQTTNDLSVGDLLIANNNVSVTPDEFSSTLYLHNGSFYTVLDVGRSEYFDVEIQQGQPSIRFTFTHLRVKALSLPGGPEISIVVLKNLLNAEETSSSSELRKAFNKFSHIRISTQLKNYKFIESNEFELLLSSDEFKKLSVEERDAITIIAADYGKKEKQKVQTTQVARSLLASYYKNFQSRINCLIRLQDPYLNALQVSYGWAVTVNKALGMEYPQTILNAMSYHHTEGHQIACESYYRYLYSGLSTSKSIFIIHPLEIDPVRDIEHFSISNSQSGPSKKVLTFSDEDCLAKYASRLSAISDVNARGAISLFAEHLELKGYKFDHLRCLSTYKARMIIQFSDARIFWNMERILYDY